MSEFIGGGGGGSGGGSGGGGSGSSTVLVPTATKTSNYNAVVGDLVNCDVSGGAFTVTLPTAPVDKSYVAVKVITITGVNKLTVACGGSDVFDTPPASVSFTMAKKQYIILQYVATGGVWIVQGNDPVEYQYILSQASRVQ